MAKQYVNLPRKALFVEREIDSIDRLGPVHFKAELEKPEPMAVSFRVLKISEVSPYTATEKKRNPDFELQEPLGLDINDATVLEPRCVAMLPPAGGAVYKLEAKAGDKTVKTGDEIQAWRRLFFQVFHMKGVNVPDLGPTFTYYEKKLFIELLDHPKGAKTEIRHVENASAEDLIWLVTPKYTVKDREPWVMALVFADQLPSLDEIEIGVEPYAGKVDLPSRWSGNETLTFELPEGKYLWFGVKAVDDAENGGKGIWLRGDGKLTVDGKDVVIPADAISIDTSQSLRSGKGFNRLTLKLPEDARNQNRFFDKSAKLTVTLWVLNGFSGGFALRDENLLAVARTAWWEPEKGPEKKLQVLNHEFGHKLGMVPKGGRRFGRPFELDAPDTLYGDIDRLYAGPNPTDELKRDLKTNNNAKGHRGAHCERGAKGKKKGESWKWSGKPDCTMFGATSADGKAAPQNFCGVCEKLLIRQNLDPSDPAGLPGFKSFVK